MTETFVDTGLSLQKFKKSEKINIQKITDTIIKERKNSYGGEIITIQYLDKNTKSGIQIVNKAGKTQPGHSVHCYNKSQLKKNVFLKMPGRSELNLSEIEVKVTVLKTHQWEIYTTELPILVGKKTGRLPVKFFGRKAEHSYPSSISSRIITKDIIIFNYSYLITHMVGTELFNQKRIPTVNDFFRVQFSFWSNSKNKMLDGQYNGDLDKLDNKVFGMFRHHKNSRYNKFSCSVFSIFKSKEDKASLGREIYNIKNSYHQISFLGYNMN